MLGVGIIMGILFKKLLESERGWGGQKWYADKSKSTKKLLLMQRFSVLLQHLLVVLEESLLSRVILQRKPQHIRVL